jgi:ABC-type branched-subunit amino acid transport system substrate-binding protein
VIFDYMIRIRSLSLACFLMVFLSAPGRSMALPADQGNGDDTVKIGLLIPDRESLAARHGAELAIREANEKGGKRTYKLVVRSTEGPWGAGSKESVSMVFDDGVVAIMGSLDGRNAHLAEQVATKTRIVFLSSWATDMTLSQAFVPWYFRCLPNDQQQATSLVREIHQKRKLSKLVVIASEAYDARYAAATFVKVARSLELAAPSVLSYGSPKGSLSEILTAIEEDGAEAIVLFGDPAFASEIISGLKQRGMNQRIFGTLAVTDGGKEGGPDWSYLEGSVLVSSGHWFTDRGMAFQKEFQHTYGYQPGSAAAYAYDGINVIIGVIRRAGVDRDRIIEAFAEVKHPSGITGDIQFDENGNRTGSAGLMMIREGIPSRLLED